MASALPYTVDNLSHIARPDLSGSDRRFGAQQLISIGEELGLGSLCVLFSSERSEDAKA